ncbi:NAD(P)H-binding protein [Exiguobacterium antarcticum]|uniref:NAD(P)H-binding protein n=1 Tax=Exiguobacterium antarcticum TaxID=132920 RepID=UPI000479B6B1|nr:NAD(P)H-binding protein [Exiguobacterium antarcticum]
MIDLDGAAKSIAAAEQVQAKQFIMVSALNAGLTGNMVRQHETILCRETFMPDRLLRDSSLAYTILRPVV